MATHRETPVRAQGVDPDPFDRKGRTALDPARAGRYPRPRSIRDPELDSVVRAAAGRIDPGGYRDTRGVFIKPPHNPYVLLADLLLILVAGVWFFFALESRAFVVALCVSAIFVAVALLVMVVTIRRIPAWHRARATARAYIAVHGGEMPRELRTWQ